MHSIHRLPTNFSLPVPADSILEGQVVDIESEKYIDLTTTGQEKQRVAWEMYYTVACKV
jgi:hypothetical protein